ncbi:MAG TPA: aminotransferase class I/II-fold pyridoxal phosphate-dependent enzyme, partial [Pirellulaceae bacterium]
MVWEWIEDGLHELDVRHLRRRLSSREGPQSAVIELGGQRLLNFGANDYLGLANDPRMIASVHDCLARYGWGSAASPLVNGRSQPHEELESALADFEGTEASLVFPTGFAANVATITALVGPGDVVLSDARNHASIIDGCRLSGAEIVVLPHLDLQAFAESLRRHSAARRRLIVTDGLFSMDGDLAPVAELARLADQFGSMLLVDEAHSTGILGAGGRGVCELQGVDHHQVVRVGTLSKALGSLGGFVVGPRRLIDW